MAVVPARDLVGFAPPPAGAESLSSLAGRLLRPDRPLPRELPDGLLWFAPSPSPWLALTRSLARLAAAGRPFVLLGCERTLAAPGAAAPGAVVAAGGRLFAHAGALAGRRGAAARRTAVALLADPGLHALVSLAEIPEDARADWEALDPAVLGLAPDDLSRLIGGEWSTATEPVRAAPPRPGFFARLTGRGAGARA